MKFNLDSVVEEYQSIENELATDASIFTDPARLKKVMRRKKSLEKTVELYGAYKMAYANLDEAKEILATEKDAEMIMMAKDQLAESEEKIPKLEEELKIELLPKDPNDEKNIILEVRAGAGGDEAALFARELCNAYINFAKEQGFGLEVLDENAGDVGGVKEMIMKVSGSGAYSKFKYEAGTHRVQRIPETEAKGRVHTSTVTVAVLPEVEALEVEIRDEDLEIMACRASGAGGQKVNKTDSAIRVFHKPTGIAVECQDERSQLQNKMKALEILRARIYAMEEEKRNAELGAKRLSQVGTGERAEKIRTYNFPQDRITDHRIGENFSNIPVVMMGKLGHIVEALSIADQTQLLEQAAGHQE